MCVLKVGFWGAPKPFGLLPTLLCKVRDKLCGLRKPSGRRCAPALVLLRGSGNLRLPKADATGHALFPSRHCCAMYGTSYAAPAALRSAFAKAGSHRLPIAHAQIRGLSPRRLHKSSASLGQRQGPRLVLFRTPDIATQCAGQVPRALAVSLRCFGATRGVSSRPSEPCRLARPFASPGGGLLGHSFCHSRESGNPDAPYCRSLSSYEFRNPAPIYHSRNAVFAFNIYTSRAVSFRRSRFASPCKLGKLRFRRPT